MANRLLIFVTMLIAGCAITHKRGANVEAVIDVYRQNRAEAETCYRSALANNPHLAGNVTLAWKVDQSGQAQDAKIVQTEVSDAGLESCLLDHLAKLKFPVQSKFAPAFVEYSWDFQRKPASSH